MVKFQFTWHKRERNPIDRVNIITLAKNYHSIENAASEATEVFTKTFGNLKANEIVSIYPLNKEGEPFGDPITLTKEK